MITEKRKHERLPADLRVWIRPKHAEGGWRKANVMDISMGGISLKAGTHCRAGESIHVHIELPKTGNRMWGKGRVVWTSADTFSPENFCCGVIFESLKRKSDRKQRLCFADDALCDHVLRFTPEALDCRPARTLDEMKSAFRLVYREYLPNGYCKPHESQLHYSAFGMLPSSCTLLLEREKKLLGTVSLIGDSPCGLPMETVFPSFVGDLRFRGRRLAEVSLLALNCEAFRSPGSELTAFHKFSATFWLFKGLVDYARYHAKVTDLVITVHPSHEKIYRNFAFVSLGKPVPYAPAGGSPGLPMHLNLEELERTLPRARSFWKFFFERNLLDASGALSACRERGIDQLIQERWSLWQADAGGSVEYLKRCYPQLQFSSADMPLN